MCNLLRNELLLIKMIFTKDLVRNIKHHGKNIFLNKFTNYTKPNDISKTHTKQSSETSLYFYGHLIVRYFIQLSTVYIMDNMIFVQRYTM